jgi:hypothetical protein
MKTIRTSASGARIQGDDYQHLYAWWQALRLLTPGTDVTQIEVEALSAGNVDDVVVRRTSGPDEYTQVKYSVDASKPLSSEWFTTRGTGAGAKSPLERFIASWQQLKTKGTLPDLLLFTNRVLDPTDPVLKLRSGTTGTLGQRLAIEGPRSAAGRGLKQWVTHSGVTKLELLELLCRLGLKTDQGPWSDLLNVAADRMGYAGLRTADTDVEIGVAIIRAMVKSGKRTLNGGELRAEIERRGLGSDTRYSTLVVEAIDRGPWSDAGQVRLDWVDLFAGDEPRARRQLRDPGNWHGRLRPDLVAAAKALKATGNDRVMVRGYMRLAPWFMCGVELPDTRQHQVACKQKGQLWSSEIAPTAFKLTDAVVDLSQGPDLAVGLSVTNDITADVVSYCKQVNLPAVRYVDLSPQGGVGPLSLPDAAAAVGWAHAAREGVRTAVRDSGARRVHLFMSAPAGAALLLGHIWNRVGTTVVYEDLNPGYVSTFEIPG